MSNGGILIVDDEELVRHVLHKTFNRLLRSEGVSRGVDVYTSSSGPESLSLIEEVDLPGRKWMLISDIVMPKMSGLQLLVAMEKRLEDRLVAKILQSGHGHYNVAVEDLGAKFLQKPILPSTYKNPLSNFLDRLIL